MTTAQRDPLTPQERRDYEILEELSRGIDPLSWEQHGKLSDYRRRLAYARAAERVDNRRKAASP